MSSAIDLGFTFVSGAASEQRVVTIEHLVIAGWTGRNVEAMEAHIRELEALGVARPASTPIFYRASAARLCQADEIQVVGEESSGEVEFVLVQWGGETWVGTGSDHTDRKVESYGITVSKQMCDKPIGPTLWRLAEIEGHWDRLVLRAHAEIGGETVLYQEGAVGRMRSPADLIGRYTDGGTLADGTAMFSGTFPAIGGVRSAARFACQLEDPVLGRKIEHAYDIRTLPILG